MPLQSETRRFNITVDVYETQIIDEPGCKGARTVKVGETTETIEVTIHWKWLVRQLGEKAVRNKTGKTSIGGTMIEVKHVRPPTSRKPAPAPETPP